MDDFNKNRSNKDGLGYWCKACRKLYWQSPDGKVIRWRYQHSPKGRASTWRYHHSLGQYVSDNRYHKTEKYKEQHKRFYTKHGGQATYERERYHKIQDEAGYYHQPRDFYPGYRFLKALEEAEVVEI